MVYRKYPLLTSNLITYTTLVVSELNLNLIFLIDEKKMIVMSLERADPIKSIKLEMFIEEFT